MSKIAATLVIYDIPEGRGIANPSDDLRPYGVRIQYSSWAFPTHGIPYPILNELKANGATVDYVRLDPDDSANLIQIATRNMRRDLRDALDRAKASELAAARTADDAADVEAANRRYRAAARTIVRRARKVLTDLKRAADRFGIDAAAFGAIAAADVIHGVSASMNDRAKLYAEAAKTIARLRGEGDAMVGAARGGDVPAEILADYADDTEYGSGFQLRNAFSHE